MKEGETTAFNLIQPDSILENAPIFVSLSSFDCGTDGTGQLRLLLGRHKCCGAHGTCRDLPITTAELFSSGAETVGICWVFIALAMGRSIPEKVELTSSSFGTLPGQRAAT